MLEIDANTIDEMKKSLALELRNYVTIIVQEYGDIMPEETLERLRNVENFKDIIRIEQTNTISMFVRNNIMYCPINAFAIINHLKKIPGYGINKNHKTCSDTEIVSNDNSYLDYIKHVFIAGLDPLGFYEETLLHETTHICGIGGATPLREGFAELKTRELAEKYNLKTSACGYPKEVGIALKLQNIFGKETVDKIAFARNNAEIFNILESDYGKEAALFYYNIEGDMQKQFSNYYAKDYSGIMGPITKTREYNKINYENVDALIENYENTYSTKSTK